MSVVLTSSAGTVTVDEIVTASLARPLRRDVLQLSTTSAPRVNYGVPGKLSGSITYLCPDLSTAMAADSLYQASAAVTLSSAVAGLDSLTHVAVGQLRMSAERTVPGRLARWLVQVEIQEV